MKSAKRCDIFLGPVFPGSDDLELDGRIGIAEKADFFGDDAEGFELMVLGGLRPFLDPALENACLPAIGFEAFSTFVQAVIDGFGDDEAFLGFSGDDAMSFGIEEGFEVGAEIKTEEGKLKAAAALEGAMAGAAIATKTAEER